MKRLLPFLLLALWQHAAATNVSGVVTGTTTWNKANSPYIVTAHIAVDKGAMLIIEPGVEVRINQNTNFFVDGGVRAIGTATDPIKFTSNLANPTRQAWPGLEIRAINTDSIIFQYCEFSHGDRAIVSHSNACDILFDHCKFSKCRSAIYNPLGMRLVSNSLITHCDGGILAAGLITGNEGSYVGGAAIVGRSGSVVKNNYVHDSNIGFYISGDQTLVTELSDNTAANCETGFRIEKHVHAHHNLAAHNVDGFYLHHPSDTIRNNTMVHNKVGAKLHFNWEPFTFLHNCIDSNADYSMKLDGSQMDIDLKNNYWGTTDSAKLDAMIFDFYDDLISPKAKFMPALQQGDASCMQYTGPVTAIADTKTNITPALAFPNPFTNSFSIELQSKASRLEVFNMAGQKLLSLDATNSNKMEVDMSAYPAGVYHYRVQMNDHTTANGKLVKQ